MDYVAKISRISLGESRALFHTLPCPRIETLQGVFHGEIIVPRWLQAFRGPALALLGLPGWCGKELGGAGTSYNLGRQDGSMARSGSIQLAPRPSLVDGGPVITVLYPATARPPLRWLVDELRWLDEGTTLLGMAMFTRLGLARIPVPFVLHKADEIQPPQGG